MYTDLGGPPKTPLSVSERPATIPSAASPYHRIRSDSTLAFMDETIKKYSRKLRKLRAYTCAAFSAVEKLIKDYDKTQQNAIDWAQKRLVMDGAFMGWIKNQTDEDKAKMDIRIIEIIGHAGAKFGCVLLPSKYLKDFTIGAFRMVIKLPCGRALPSRDMFVTPRIPRQKANNAGSKHFLKTFWAHALTRGREHTNPQLFEKGEEVHVSGLPGTPYGRVLRLENRSSRDNLQGPSETFEIDASDDEPLTTKKRRRHKIPAGEPKVKRKRESEPGTAIASSAPAQRTRAFGPKSKAKLSPPSKQRRASSPGPRKVEGTRQFSLTKLTDTDAEGELDMDVFGEAEVEEELMQMSPDDPDARDIPNSHSDPAKVNGTIVEFEDLPSYSPDIQDTIEVSQVIVEDGHLSVDEGRSSPDPLFDSISQSGNDEGSRSPVEPAVPFHRARAANPLVKFIDAAPLMDKASGVVNPAKTRLISGQPSNSSRDSGSNASQKARPKPGPGGRSSASRGKNRSSLLTAVKGGLTSVKGRFEPAKDVREEPEPIENAPSPSHLTEHEFAITSWSDEDAAGETDHEHLATAPLTDQMGPASNHAPAPIPVPSGQELLEIAGLKSDAAALPDFEDEANVERPPQPTNAISVDTLADDVPTEDAASPATMTVEDEAARKSLAEAKEQLFPSVQTTASVTSISSSSWKTSKDNTIFGPMYKLQEPAKLARLTLIQGEDFWGNNTNLSAPLAGLTAPLHWRTALEFQPVSCWKVYMHRVARKIELPFPLPPRQNWPEQNWLQLLNMRVAPRWAVHCNTVNLQRGHKRLKDNQYKHMSRLTSRETFPI
ncbi:hypothetical protein DEU56DRAFT_947163 [Suillus clintonianus]|uniref:uncharacterized protein n=1 Tax=Suillus clintonianus TaxID=1904413 RepID=UPI001B87A586|nr:uncharacterized protein DEU56DRAFT_947163 [Suillus clintonianus]KAG2135985.1 hypothetical protein DEU56DRAFT_947163 [Suillus clintonianus]